MEGNAWIKDPRLCKKFWATLRGEGYTEKQIHDALKVDSLHNYTGGFEQALREVRRGMSELVNHKYTATWNGPWMGGNILVCIRDDDRKAGRAALHDEIAQYAPREDAQQPAQPGVEPQPEADPNEKAETKWIQDDGKEKKCHKHGASCSRKEWSDGGVSWSHKMPNGQWCRPFGKSKYPAEEEMPF